VKQRSGAATRFASPVRALAQRFTYMLLVAAAFLLMIVGKADNVIVEKVRTAFSDQVAPLMDVLSRPVDRAAQFVDEARQFADLRAENARLREDHDRLMKWQLIARQLDTENQALRKLLNLAPNPQLSFISGRVVSDSGGAFAHSVLVVAGGRDGVKKGQAVITGEGLAGRIVEVGERSARILLLTDINSRIPVMIERTGERALLAGDNSPEPRLLYLSPDANPAPGDQIVTSGHGGVFIPGLPVGFVSTVEKGIVTVHPYVNWERMDYVRLLDYELPGILLRPPSYAQAEDRR